MGSCCLGQTEMPAVAAPPAFPDYAERPYRESPVIVGSEEA
jgi:hypothetical protein